MALRLKYKNNQFSCKELLEKDFCDSSLQKFTSFSHINLKVKNGLAADIIKDVFGLKEPHTTYNQNQITLQSEILRLLTMVSYQLSRCLIWELVPQSVRKRINSKLRSNPGNQIIVHIGSAKLIKHN